MDVQNWPTHDPLSRKWPTNLPNPSNQSPHRMTHYNNILQEFISRWPPDKDRMGGIITSCIDNLTHEQLSNLSVSMCDLFFY